MLKVNYYIWSDVHNNDVNIVVQFHTTKLSLEVDSKCCWCSVCLNKLLEMLTFDYESIGNIDIGVSKYRDIEIIEILVSECK